MPTQSPRVPISVQPCASWLARDLGNYTVTETTKDIDGKEHIVKYSVNGAAPADGKAASAEVKKNETTTVEFEDNFTNKPGILEITKTIKGDVTPEEAAGLLTFEVKTTVTEDGHEVTKWVGHDGKLTTEETKLTLNYCSIRHMIHSRE